MPSYLDLALLGIVLISALLSMVRGFTREVLAIASWAAAAVAAYLLYGKVTPYLDPYIAKDIVKTIVAVAIVFLVTLVIVSIITVKLSDAILDSRVGALDRTLGFVFGAARGFLLGVVAFLIFTSLVPPKSQPVWVAEAKTRPLLEMTGEDLKPLLPPDTWTIISRQFNKHDKSAPTEDVPDEGADKADLPPAAPERRTDATPTPPTSPSNSDKQKLDNLLGRPASRKQ